MSEGLLPILMLLAASAALAVAMLAMGRLFGPRRNTPVKEMPYESGMDPIHDARRRFRVRFHLVAVAFLVFDVELLFLYPWAVASRNPEGIPAAVGGETPMIADRTLVFAGVMAFLVLLVLGLVYDWRKGLFQWR